MHKKIAVLIPCRLNSRRFPGKALKIIGKKALIHHVYDNTSKSFMLSGWDHEAFVCTDSEEIIEYLNNFNIPYIKTSSLPRNGTERIAECVRNNKLEYDYFIDVQGDEPLINEEIINCVMNLLIKFDKNQEVIVLPHQQIYLNEASNSSIVKLVTNSKEEVLYMSRAVIPFEHEVSKDFNVIFKKHLSVIGFTKASLKKYSILKQDSLEKIEDIELLRAIENNIKIISPLSSSTTFSIDYPEDLEKARRFL